MFLAAPLPDELRAPLLAFRTPKDELRVHGREIYWLCRGKTSESLIDWPRLGRAVALPALTVRNSTTIRRLVAKHAAPA